MQKQIHKVGDILELEMMRPEGDRKFPISKTEKGLICFLKTNTKEGEKKPYYEYGSIWKCEVIEVFPNKLFVHAKQLLLSAKDNATLANTMAKTAFVKQPTERKKKEKPNYQYRASYEK